MTPRSSLAGGLRGPDATVPRPRTRRLLLATSLLLALGGAALLYMHDRGVAVALDRAVRGARLEDEARRFGEDARKLLERTRLGDYLQAEGPALDAFRTLLESSGGKDGPAVYLRVEEGEKQTLFFRGPDLVQKLTVSPEGVEILEGDGRAIRHMLVQRGEGPPEYQEVQRPLEEALDGQLVEAAFEGPEARFEARVAKAQADLRASALRVGMLALLLVAGVFFWIGYQVERIRHLEHLSRRQAELAFLGTLAGGLVHELRNPLNGIGLNLHLVEEALEGADERVRASAGRPLDRIRPALGHLERIVAEFLDFARPRAHPHEEVDLEDLVRQVADFLTEQAREASVTVEVEAEDEDFVVHGDRERLRQVFLNLGTNGIQASPEGGVLRFRLRRQDADLRVEVEDQGEGVPEGQEEAIFGLFYTSRDGGTGLGLPIVRRILEDHGGAVFVEPNEAGGARFCILVPAEGRAAPATKR